VKQDNIIQLLLIDKSENDAVEMTNVLRNEGLTLHPTAVSNSTIFDKEIDKRSFDIILFTPTVKDLDIGTLLQRLKELKSDAVVIVIADKTPEETVYLLKQGVSCVIPAEPEELISLTVQKEFRALKGLRSEYNLSTQLNDSEKRCQQLINSSRDAIAYVHEGMHILSNDPYFKMFGYESRDDIEAMPIMDLVSPRDSTKLKELLQHYSHRNGQYATKNDSQTITNTLKVTGIKDDESEFQMQMEFQPASMAGEDCLQIIIRNDAINQKTQEKLQQKLDILNTQCQETGLYNRRYFLSQLESTIEQADSKNAYLLFITLDNFQSIRNKLGVLNSDHVIVDIATLLKKQTIDKDVLLARFESYRFGAIIKTDDENTAMELAENIRKTVDTHIAIAQDKSISTSCSIGIVQLNSSRQDSQNSLTHAQKACNEAIEKGGNQIKLYIPDANEMDNQQLIQHWASEIKNAIKQKRMFLMFQPFVSLMGENSENYELYIRMRNEQGEIISPSKFMPLAEASSHSIHVDRWIIAEAIRILAEKNTAGHNFRFIIKLSSASLNDNKFIAWVKHNLDRYRVKGKSVIFQINTHKAFENLRTMQKLTQQVHQLGCLLSFEHFGVEEDSFTLLKHVIVDFLKLDLKLIKDISTNGERLEALNNICTRANDMGIKTIVPFVEEAGSLSVIWQSGAHYIQGAFLQEPSTTLDFDFSNFS